MLIELHNCIYFAFKKVTHKNMIILIKRIAFIFRFATILFAIQTNHMYFHKQMQMCMHIL